MSQLIPNSYVWYLIAGVGFEIIANILLKKSEGFTKKAYAIAAIMMILVAFTCLGKAVEGIELSIAYAIWGGIGLVATALLSITFFQQRILFTGWLGILLLLLGVLLLKLA
jgi:spermidine export protein MdtI